MSDQAEILPRMYHKPGGKYAKKARLQRNTPGYKEWRAKYEKTEKFKEKLKVLGAKRRADPEWREKFREYARRTKERNRIKYLVRSAIARSRQNGLECHEEYLKTVIAAQRPTHCPCCKVGLDYKSSRGGNPTPKLNCPSLDRIDCTKGYIEGNVAIICWRCNAIKRDATLAELDRIVSYMKGQLR